jgi:hypothetical protein
MQGFSAATWAVEISLFLYTFQKFAHPMGEAN